jgi:hypothetical protein
VSELNAPPVVVALPTTAGGYAYSNGSAVLFGGSAAHKVSVISKLHFHRVEVLQQPQSLI